MDSKVFEKKIKKIRQELHGLFLQRGNLDDIKVVEKSQELDRLLNKYFFRQ